MLELTQPCLAASLAFLKPKKGQPISPAWNVFMWVTLFIGCGLLMVLYCLEWFAVQNNPKTNVSEIFSSKAIKQTRTLSKKLL